MGNERVEGYAEGFRIGWDKCRNKIIKKVKSFPVGNLCLMKCTDCKGFDRFINTFTNGLIKSIEDETENHDKTKKGEKQ